MAVDGSLKFDTKIDSSGFETGVKKIGGLAAKGVAAVGTALAGASAYAIKVGADFEEGMSKVAAISGASGKDIEALTNKAKEMGAKTKFSATEASEAMQYMAMAGWKASDMISGIDGIMNLAAASGEDLAGVSDIVTDALTAFGLQAKDSAHFADVLAAASSNSNTNVSMMGATFKYAAPLAGALKYSVEDVAVAIGLMANAGIKGEQAGTSLRSMFTRLAKPPKECAEAMDALGISITNSDGSAKPLNQTLQEMRAKFSKLSDTQKTQYASSIAGTEAMSGLLAIVNASDADFSKLTKAIGGADGAAEKMAKTMQDNLKGKLTILGSSLEGLGIAAYDKFEKPMKKAVDGAIKKVEILSASMSSGKLSKSMDKAAKGIATITEAALDLATDAIPVMINGFAFLADHGKEVITVTAGLAAGFIYFSNQQKIANAITMTSTALQKAYALGSLAMETATSLLTGKITLQTAAQEALSIAQLASPQGLLTAAIIAGTAAIAAYVVLSTNSRKETDKNTIATNKLVDEYDTLNDTLAANKKQREENIESVKAEAGGAEVMLNKLEDLSKKENKSNAEKKQMQNYVEKLNELIPDLNLKYDQEKDALNKSTDAIRSNIEAQKDLALAKAYQDAMVEVAKDLAEAQMKLDDATVQHTRNTKALAETSKKAQAAQKEYYDAGANATKEQKEAMEKASAAHVKAQENYNKTKTTVDGLQRKVSDLNKEYDKTDKYAQNALDSADIENKLAEITEIAKEKGVKIPKAVADAIKKGSYKVPKSIEEMRDLIKYDNMVKDASKYGIKVPENIAKAVSDGKMKPADAINKMQSLIEFKDLLTKSVKAGTSVPESIQKKILDGKLKPQDAVRQMQNLVSFNDLMRKANIAGIAVPDNVKNNVLSGKTKPKDAVQQMKDLVSFYDLLGKAEIAGAAVPENVKNNVLSGKTKPSEAVQQMKNLVSFNDLLSKSSLAGADVPEKIKQGVLSGKLSPSKAVEEMNKATISKANESVPSMKTIGANAGSGMASGLNSKKNPVKSAGASLASSAINGSACYGSMVGMGANAGQGFIDGLASMAIAGFNAGWNFVTNALQGGKKAQKSRSPSRKWRDEVGMMAGAGYAIGIDKSSPEVNKSVRNMVNGAISESKRYAAKMTIPSMETLKNVAANRSSGLTFQSVSTVLPQYSDIESNKGTEEHPKDVNFNAKLYIDGRELTAVIMPYVSNDLALSTTSRR